jgi:hypothetical protein
MYVHTITAAALVMLVSRAASPAGPPDVTATLTVRVVNLAPIGAPTLDRALRDARRIYRTIGIDVAWTERDDLARPAPTSARELRVVLLPRAPGAAAAQPDQMAVAVLTHGRPIAAYVFFDRVEKTADEYAVAVDFVLSAVIAHEVAHLVVCKNVHSPAGLMRPRWGRQELIEASQGQLQFSRDSSWLMRRELAAPAVVLADGAAARRN